MERKRQRIGLLGRIDMLGLAVERKRQRIGLLGFAMERDRCSEEDVGRSLWQIGGGVCWVLPWKGRDRESGCWVLSWKGRGKGLFVEIRWISALKKVSLGLAMERKRQRIDLLGLAVERKGQRIGLLGLAMERELSSHGARRGGAGRKVMAEYS